MSDTPRIQPVTPENQDIFFQQLNTASVPLSTFEILSLRKLIEKAESNNALLQQHGGGGGGGMSDGERITRLETHFQYIQRDLGDLKAGQQQITAELSSISKILSGLATKTDLSAWKLQWTALCVGAIALIVGGIIGGLSWIKPDAAPVVIQGGPGPGFNSPAASNPSTPATRDAPAPRP